MTKTKLVATIEEVFERYRFCKFTPGNNERASFVGTVNMIVSALSEADQKLIRTRYMEADDVRDYQIYNFVLDPPVSKDTYMRRRKRAFERLKVMFEERGIMPL